MLFNIQEQAMREFGLENPYTLLICEVAEMWGKGHLSTREAMRLTQCIYNSGKKNIMSKD